MKPGLPIGGSPVPVLAQVHLVVLAVATHGLVSMRLHQPVARHAAARPAVQSDHFAQLLADRVQSRRRGLSGGTTRFENQPDRENQQDVRAARLVLGHVRSLRQRPCRRTSAKAKTSPIRYRVARSPSRADACGTECSTRSAPPAQPACIAKRETGKTRAAFPDNATAIPAVECRRNSASVRSRLLV